ncbi:MAG: hypothetical protein FD166_2981 [Bacteroidetes bacterium]|nr:MAG: hypothetical protein FD166_2981 [Bacteroidota bacterium]
MSNTNQINRKPRTKLQFSAQELLDIRIRLKALEFANHPTGGVDIEYARRLEHYIKSGEIKTSSQLHKEEEQS